MHKSPMRWTPGALKSFVDLGETGLEKARSNFDDRFQGGSCSAVAHTVPVDSHWRAPPPAPRKTRTGGRRRHRAFCVPPGNERGNGGGVPARHAAASEAPIPGLTGEADADPALPPLRTAACAAARLGVALRRLASGDLHIWRRRRPAGRGCMRKVVCEAGRKVNRGDWWCWWTYPSGCGCSPRTLAIPAQMPLPEGLTGRNNGRVHRRIRPCSREKGRTPQPTVLKLDPLMLAGRRRGPAGGLPARLPKQFGPGELAAQPNRHNSCSSWRPRASRRKKWPPRCTSMRAGRDPPDSRHTAFSGLPED